MVSDDVGCASSFPKSIWGMDSVSQWRYTGPHEGLYYGIVSSDGIMLNAATKDSAEAAVRILNRFEEQSAFAEQLLQDQCENAYIEATIHKQVVRAASAAVIAFGSDTEADAIHHLGQVISGNVYSIITDPRSKE